ncbi:MFS general substrate transporter [Lindgomyces ingoldianus]|uniref:MFS general substrate transporter n=1 Tax=Lindgomyces ingoldianus TaxID=673940 RepID=A0ACB6R3K5_9PLEO|nr:MFS general substrate transporter [Lindgomyces ingoldianus]KAF2472910.1 MFS general substrate transporter [Lindgomyces ingoldianus]
MLSHTLRADDPDNPMNWPTYRRVYASAVAWACGFTVAFGITIYTSGLTDIMATFNISMTKAISGYSLYLFGIFFAPIYSPHLAERYGRSILYLICLFVCGLFHLGAAFSQSFAALAACRFFAGLAGGPCLVLIEGTFADIWSAETTNTYYSFLGVASYFGAAAGPIVGNFVVQAGGWRWAEYTELMLILVVFAFAIGMPETYGREIPRRRNKVRSLAPPSQPLAESGVTIAQMATITVINPLKQLVFEPIVIMISFCLALNWAVTFQWFITVPVVLQTVYGFSPQRAGIAFSGAIGGASLAALCTIAIEQAIFRSCKTTMAIEKRLIPAMYGSVLITSSIFWVGWTAKPSINYLSPIFGTAIFVWGGLHVLISLVTYLFDAYPPAGTLSALTAAACTRIAVAGIIPLVIIQAFMNLGGNWALSIFGFISIPCIAVPFVLYKWGPALRARSPYSKSMSIHSHIPVPMEMSHMGSQPYEGAEMHNVQV